jgi:hypothetical protein
VLVLQVKFVVLVSDDTNRLCKLFLPSLSGCDLRQRSVRRTSAVCAPYVSNLCDVRQRSVRRKSAICATYVSDLCICAVNVRSRRHGVRRQRRAHQPGPSDSETRHRLAVGTGQPCDVKNDVRLDVRQHVRRPQSALLPASL